MTMASRIAVMHEGRILQVGTPDEIYERPSSRFVADFIGNVNLMDARVESSTDQQWTLSTADVPQLKADRCSATTTSPVSVALRPEKIRLTRHAPERPGLNAVKGVVREKAYCGSFTLYHLGLPSGAVLKVAPANVDRLAQNEPAIGDEAWAHWSASAPVVLSC